jgi:cell division protein FtsN
MPTIRKQTETVTEKAVKPKTETESQASTPLAQAKSEASKAAKPQKATIVCDFCNETKFERPFNVRVTINNVKLTFCSKTCEVRYVQKME